MSSTLVRSCPKEAVYYPELALLIEVAKPICAGSSPEELEKRWLELIFRLVPAERVVVILSEGGLEETSIVFGEDRSKCGESLSGIGRDVVERAFQDKRPHLVRRDSSEILNNLAGMEFPGCAIAVVPLTVSGRMRGVIYIDSMESPDQICADHVDLLSAVGTIAVVALDRVRGDGGTKRNGHSGVEFGDDVRVPFSNGSRRVVVRDSFPFGEFGLMGDSAQMTKVKEVIGCAGRSNCTVLVHGESGTGKEVAARCIHASSSRASKNFVPINCGALTDTLLESELFGHERGAFTGAVAAKRGKFELAEGGTLFLDEIGTMPAPLQTKLLRVLEDRKFERLGGLKPISVDFRLLAATNSDLEEEVAIGAFRMDLYHRLKVIVLLMPPLRERRDDILLLAKYYARHFCEKNGVLFLGIEDEAREALESYFWPGNIRELKNAIEHAIVLGESGVIRTCNLPDSLRVPRDTNVDFLKPRGLKDTTNGARRDRIRRAFIEANCSYRQAAEILGINPSYLSRLVKQLELRAELSELACPRGRSSSRRS